MSETNGVRVMPLLALRGLVVFPGMLLHFDVGRKRSVNAVNQAMSEDQLLFLVCQKDMRDSEPEEDQLFRVGCVAKIKQIFHLHGDTLRVMVEGICRASLTDVMQSVPYFSGLVKELPVAETTGNGMMEKALVRLAKQQFDEYAELSARLSPDVLMSVMAEKKAGALSDYIATNITIPFEKKQQLLEECHPTARLRLLVAMLREECDLLSIEQEIEQKVQNQMEDNQRDYYLREQLKAIWGELGEGDNPQEEAEQYRERIEALPLEDDAREKLLKEADRLCKMPAGSHEATVVRGYLDTCLEMPWGKHTSDKHDIAKAAAILDREHYGLQKVKARILEALAVYGLSGSVNAQTLCLVGPPGVGKTSIARSIAKCMGRKYVRVSLGGVRDETDIRGHRRTYIGAMPGRIINAIRQAGSSNPLILLDEVDKLGADFRGDPSAALLEALDPEQNCGFVDHFLDIPFDLSQVLFITTANTTETIPPALYDRMEVIELGSYTREEKFQIAKRHLVKKQEKRHGLNGRTLRITNDALYGLIDYYTREAGVRGLERQIASLCRKAAKQIVSDAAGKVTIREADLESLLGVHRFKPEALGAADEVGLVNGLAWTSVGGETMQLEAVSLEGSGKIVLTGSLGDVMKESAQAAVSCVRARTHSLRIDHEFYKNRDIHIHAPEGAVPKDGPSAGIAMATALVSALTDTPVRRDVAMTGEITLRGRVLPIGGLKEKTMAAYRAGIRTVIVPKDNTADLSEIDPVVQDALEFVPVESVDQVWRIALANDGYIARNHPPVQNAPALAAEPPRGASAGPVVTN